MLCLKCFYVFSILLFFDALFKLVLLIKDFVLSNKQQNVPEFRELLFPAFFSFVCHKPIGIRRAQVASVAIECGLPFGHSVFRWPGFSSGKLVRLTPWRHHWQCSSQEHPTTTFSSSKFDPIP